MTLISIFSWSYVTNASHQVIIHPKCHLPSTAMNLAAHGSLTIPQRWCQICCNIVYSASTCCVIPGLSRIQIVVFRPVAPVNDNTRPSSLQQLYSTNFLVYCDVVRLPAYLNRLKCLHMKVEGLQWHLTIADIACQVATVLQGCWAAPRSSFSNFGWEQALQFCQCIGS